MYPSVWIRFSVTTIILKGGPPRGLGGFVAALTTGPRPEGDRRLPQSLERRINSRTSQIVVNTEYASDAVSKKIALVENARVSIEPYPSDKVAALPSLRLAAFLSVC